MDLKAYFKKIRDAEAAIPTPFVVIASLETPDGGKTGTFTEVSKKLAARMITEGRGRLASDGESAVFKERQSEARLEVEALAAAQRMQFTLVQASDNRQKPPKGPKE